MRPTFDLELARRCLAGDPLARDQVGGRLVRAVRMLSIRNRRLAAPLSDEAIEEIAAEAVLRAWSRLGDFGGRAALESWLFRFCELTMRNALRARERERGRWIELQPEELAGAAAGNWERVHRALDRLPETELAVVRMHHFDGQTFEEIAAATSQALSTIKGRYYRGIARLRWALGEGEHA